MASSFIPLRAVAYTFEVALVSQADAKLLQANPTLAAGDVKISKDGGALANITTLPTAIGAGKLVTVTLSQAEMTADRIAVIFSDQAGAEWCDLQMEIFTAARGVDDLAFFSPVANIGLDVTEYGGIQADMVEVNGNFTAAEDFEKMLNGEGGVTLSAILGANAITAASLAADAGTEIGTAVWASATRTLTSFGTLVADIWAAASRTLTQTVQQISALVSGTTIPVHRGDSFSQTLTGLSSNTGWAQLWFTVKRSLDDADADAVLQVLISDPGDVGDGLQLLNGSDDVTAAQASLAVASSTSVTLAIDEAVTAQLRPKSGYHWDIQARIGADTLTLGQGRLNVTADVTRATS
jgi:hypothetical protein